MSVMIELSILKIEVDHRVERYLGDDAFINTVDRIQFKVLDWYSTPIYLVPYKIDVDHRV